jgi:hypothetical protein
VHGFRSTAKDWCAEHGIQHEVSEAMLGHSVAKNESEAAYLRTDYLDERRKVMRRWADFILPARKPVHPQGRGIRRSRWMVGG